MSAVATDPRIKPGAYVRNGTTVYLVVEQERDADGGITGRYALENIMGQHCSGKTYVHDRILRTASEIAAHFDLVKAAPDAGVPDYLDAQMSEHLRSTDILPDGQQNFGRGASSC